MKKYSINFIFLCAVFCLFACDDSEITGVEVPANILISKVQVKTYNKVEIDWEFDLGTDDKSDGGIIVCVATEPIENYESLARRDTSGTYKTSFYISKSNVEFYVCTYLVNNDKLVYGEKIPFTLWLGASGETVQDIDGNEYETVKIGDQVWMSENLKVTHYRNGDDIPIITMQEDQKWINDKNGMCCFYNDDALNNDINGKLYNWYAVADERGLAPEGYNIPSKDDLKVLIEYLGGVKEAAHFLSAKTKWRENEVLSDGLSNFMANPYGFREIDWYSDPKHTEYRGFNEFAKWWSYSSEEITPGRVFYYSMDFASDGSFAVGLDLRRENEGISVRCLKK